MPQEQLKKSQGNLAFSQAIIDRLHREKMLLQSPAELPQDTPQNQSPQEEQQESIQETPKQKAQEVHTQNQAQKDTNLSISELAGVVQTGMEALNKLADAIKENTKEKQVHVGKLKERLSNRKKKT